MCSDAQLALMRSVGGLSALGVQGPKDIIGELRRALASPPLFIVL
jgi:hypothetical protein